MEEPKYDEKGFTQWMWRVLHKDRLFLGKNVSIGSFSLIDAQFGVYIEDDVQVSMGVRILSHSHIDNRSGYVTLRKGSCIGANSVIMPNVHIGENSIVGALSFVPEGTTIPNDEIWAGIPAKFIKKVEEMKPRESKYTWQ